MSKIKMKDNWSSKDILLTAIWESFLKLDPRVQFKTPVMFVAYISAIVVTAYTVLDPNREHFLFNLQLSIWLWLTLLFANFSGAIAEGRGKAQAASLKTAQSQIQARRLEGTSETNVPATSLVPGDIVVCSAGDVIPADGEVVEGIATVDESAITGESAPVIRESGSDLSAVTAGTRVISDEIRVRVTSEIGQTFFDRMIKLIEGAERHKTPNEIALNIVLSSLTFIFLLSVLSVWAFAGFSSRQNADHGAVQYVTIPVLVSLLVCLIPTTIGALLHAIGIAGMDRLIRKNVIAKSGRCVEAAGDIDLLMVDKTGTITLGNRMASDFIPAPGYTQEQCAQIAQLASLSDETPEGRSIVILAKKLFDMRAQELTAWTIEVVPFSAQNKMSGINFLDASGNIVRKVRKGAVSAIKEHVLNSGGVFPEELQREVERISKSGGTPLLVSDNDKVVGLVHLKDVVKGGIRDRFADMRKMGIRTLMITGDNALTAAAIAAEAGVDDFIAEATPEAKLNRIREEQYGGHLIAMTGDGTNDAPALAQADVGVAMSSGTQASREAGNMVDLDSDPTKILTVVEVGKQLLMTRGALTTFSIANDIAKYFAILPAMFSGFYAGKETIGPLSSLNIMHLTSPSSAILSTVIFNALIILTLIPLALRGASYLRTSADKMLKHNLLVYGLGGLVAPFVGIKCIDTLISLLGLL